MTSRLVAEHVGSGMGEEEVAQGQMEKSYNLCNNTLLTQKTLTHWTFQLFSPKPRPAPLFYSASTSRVLSLQRKS